MPIAASHTIASSSSETSDAELRRRYLTPALGIANALWLIAMHAVLIGWLWYTHNLIPLWLYIILSAMVCVTHQRILSEWFHEATHWNLLPDRIWNDRVTDILIGSFIGTKVAANRPGHFRHHAVTRFFNPEDPDTRDQAALSRAELLTGIGRDITGLTMISKLLRKSSSSERQRAGNGLAWYSWLALLHGTGLLLSVAAGKAWIYPIYFFSLLTLYPLADRCRLYGQHAEFTDTGMARLNGSPVSRTFHSGLLGQLLLNSPMIMYHHEHHARPNLPYRALRAVAVPSDDLNVNGLSSIRVSKAVVAGLT